MLDLEFAERTDPGKVRSNNEDALGHVLPMGPAQVQSQGWFFVTADGMGGHEQGEVASALAVMTALEGFPEDSQGCDACLVAAATGAGGQCRSV